MPRRRLLILVPLAGLAVIPALSYGAASHKVRLTVRDATVQTSGSGLNQKQTTAGTVSGNPFGQGVESISEKFSAQGASRFTLKGRIRFFFPSGMLTGNFLINGKPKRDGSVTGTGKVTITGGTGSYHGASGRLPFAGSESAKTGVFVAHVTGSVSY